MARFLIESVDYIDRNPKETHYLYISEENGVFEFIAGEVIGQGIGAGGGEGYFKIPEFRNFIPRTKFLQDIGGEWIREELERDNLVDEKIYENILNRSKAINMS